ncbi:hypothetical protein [Sphingomonas immobilis]|uniref:SGNH hydrolase-type esterase domain-containing protein n=1 Tax=Sphingomonas immobilis TaxID=3063997 RepID=A0ABT8ZV31_9SPHN|nr:hypothetical protein [Sphingomonas sp. CA1-15]MDO7841067.1 hypothetical protein [Sphingomonas sp. CA1-15]
MALDFAYPIVDASLFWHQGRPAGASTLPMALVAASGATPAYFPVGANSRLKCSSAATEVEIGYVSTTNANNRVGVLHSGRVWPAGTANAGVGRLRFTLPQGVKSFELVTPYQHAAGRYSAGQGTPFGVWITEVRANAAITFAAPPNPTSYTRRIVVLADSIGGAYGRYQALQGWIGIGQNGLHIKSLTSAQGYKGAYNAGTAYALGDWVLFNGRIERSLAAQTGASPASSPSTWTVDGIDGLVTAYRSWGSKTIEDDWDTAPKRAEHAAFIAAFAPTVVMPALGSNDYALPSVPTRASVLTNATGMVDAIRSANSAAAQVMPLPILRGANGVEIANSQSWTLADLRSDLSGLTSGRAWLDVFGGASAIPVGKLADFTHPTTIGQRDLGDLYWRRAVNS